MKIGTVLATAMCLLPAGAFPGQDGPADLELARTALEQWVETRRIISQERRDWTLGREMLTERIAVVEREIQSLASKRAEAEESIAEADRKRAELLEENERLRTASGTLSETVLVLEARMVELLARLPQPIAEHVKPLSQRLPQDGVECRLSLAERFQNVVGILNEVDKFNRDITITSEVRALPDGTSAEVTALYVGIGQGYYVGANGTIAGVGASTSGGWTWTAANHAAPEIAEAIAIVKSERVARFVPLPVSIDRGGVGP